MALNHVTFPTKIFDATVDFLARVLEFPQIASPADVPMRTAWFDLGDGQALHVLEIAETGAPVNDGEYGRHVALSFPHARWLRIKSQLEREKIELVPPLRVSNTSRFFVHDPNGYCFEFVMS